MDNTHTKLGQALLKSLIALREKKGEIHIEDVGALLTDMAKSLPHNSEADLFVRTELEKMSGEITSGKQELLDLMHGEDTNPEHIGHASSQLGAVVKHTEEATNIIMDSVDEIQDAFSKEDPDLESKVSAASARIYEACNFQDITGQRITKVLATLEHIEQKIVKLASLFSDTPVMQVTPSGNDDDSAEQPPASVPEDEKELLKGPALPDDAPSQEDIDKLFASLN